MKERYITCQREGCENIARVRNAYEQRTRKFCGRRCSGIVTANWTKVSRMQAGRKGGAISGQRRRARLLEKLRGMKALDAYRLGRMEGWHAGARSVRSRLTVAA